MLICVRAGINSVTFYFPQLLQSLAVAPSAALGATLAYGLVNHLSTYVSVWAADEYGRRGLLIGAGFGMTGALVRCALLSLSSIC